MQFHKLFGTATMCIASLQTLLAAPQEFHALLHSGQFLHFFCFFSCKYSRKLHTTWLMWTMKPTVLRFRKIEFHYVSIKYIIIKTLVQLLSSFRQKFLKEPFLQKFYCHFLEILHSKQMVLVSLFSFLLKISRERKYVVFLKERFLQKLLSKLQ